MSVVAAFHLGIWSEDIMEKGFGGHRSGSGEVGADNASGVADLVAGEASCKEDLALLSISIFFSHCIKTSEFFTGGLGLLRSDEGRGIVGKLNGSLTTKLEVSSVSRKAMDEGVRVFAAVSGSEIRLDFGGASLLVPDPVFTDLKRRATWGGGLADFNVDEIVFKGLGVGGIENSVEVDFKLSLVVTCEGAVGPEVWDHGAGGDDEIADSRATVKAKNATVKIQVRAWGFSSANERILVVDTGCKFNPCLNGEGAFESEFLINGIVFFSDQLDDGLKKSLSRKESIGLDDLKQRLCSCDRKESEID